MQILFPLLVCKVEQPHPVDNGDSVIEVSSYISEVISDCGCEMAIARLGVLAFIMSFFLKMEDRKKGYGLELPNIRK